MGGQLGSKGEATILRILHLTASIQKFLSIIQTEMDKLFTRLAMNHSSVWLKKKYDDRSFEIGLGKVSEDLT
jgi:hypothetical protein